MRIKTQDTGPVHVMFTIGDITVMDSLYPLCVNAVQTEVTVDGQACIVRPDVYTQRTVYDD